MAAGLLLCVAWIPWSLAALLYASNALSHRVTQTLANIAIFVSVLIAIALLNRPVYVYAVEPLGSFIDYVLSDPSLAELGGRIAFVRGFVVVECVIAIVLPAVLMTCYIGAVFYELVIAPPLHLLAMIRGTLSSHVETRLESARRRIAERRRRAETERLQQQTQQAKAFAEFQQEQENRLTRQRSIAQIVNALEELPSLPDFKRATRVAKEAKELSSTDRQELFRLFRPLITTHLGVRLEAGANQDHLLDSLRELLGELGVAGADFESAYILAEAQSQLPDPTVRFEREYRGKITELRDQYQIRIRAVADIDDPDIVARLVEIEEEKLKSALIDLSMTNDDPLSQLDLSALQVEPDHEQEKPE